MSLLGRFFLWRARRHAAHQRRLRQGKVIYTWPQADSSAWSTTFMNSVKKGHR